MSNSSIASPRVVMEKTPREPEPVPPTIKKSPVSSSSSSSNSNWTKFVNGGLAGSAATIVVQPIDLLKTRMQLSGKGTGSVVYRSSFHAAHSIYKAEGLMGFYNGLSAGILRQATYTTARLGIYQLLEDSYRQNNDSDPNFLIKLLIGMVSGGVGALIGTPAEISLVRMTSDGRLPLDQRRNYKHCFDALGRIVREEGFLTLWRGWRPTVGRAVILNAAQLSAYSQSKQVLLSSGYFKDNTGLHFVASLISGFISTIVSMPIDITKTRLQTMKSNEYKGMVDAFVKIVQRESVFSLWKGFTPYFLRLGPHTILTFIALENLNKIIRG